MPGIRPSGAACSTRLAGLAGKRLEEPSVRPEEEGRSAHGVNIFVKSDVQMYVSSQVCSSALNPRGRVGASGGTVADGKVSGRPQNSAMIARI